jgi:CAAX protease family protein
MHTITTVTHVEVKPQTRTGVQWREVILFTFLAYSLTWIWQGIKILPHLGELLTASKTPADSTVIFGNVYYHILGMFGPMLAAIIMRLFVSREGLRGSLGLRQPLKYYLTAVLAPILFITAICLIMALIGAARFALPEEEMPAYILPILALLLIPEIIVSFGEEYGWRGYLLPRLMPLGEIRASLIVGVIWALWHTPVLLAGVLYGGNSFWLALPIFVFTVTMSTFAYTWLGRASHHSSMLASIFHGSTNWFANKVAILLAAGSLLSFGFAMGMGWMLIVLTVYGILRRSPQVPLDQPA